MMETAKEKKINDNHETRNETCFKKKPWLKKVIIIFGKIFGQ